MEIAVRIGAVTALLLAAGQYLVRTDVVTAANSQRLVSMEELEAVYERYDDSPADWLVEAVQQYERQNFGELSRGGNPSTEVLPEEELCGMDRAYVVEVFTSSSDDPPCDGDPDTKLGRNVSFERIVARNAMESDVEPTEARTAIERAQSAEYRRYRVCIHNAGRFPATAVAVTAAPGYSMAPGFDESGFTLKPGEEVVRDFVSVPGYTAILQPATEETRGPTPDRVSEVIEIIKTGEIDETSCLKRPGMAFVSDFLVTYGTDARPPAFVVGWGLFVLFVLLLAGTTIVAVKRAKQRRGSSTATGRTDTST